MALHGHSGNTRELLRLLKVEHDALEGHQHGHIALWYGPPESAPDDQHRLLPLVEVLDMAHRCIHTLQDLVISPAIPPPVRDRHLSNLSAVVDLVQRLLFLRIQLLAEAMLDPTYNLTMFRRDLTAACATPRYYCFVDPSVRRCIRSERDGALGPRLAALPQGPNTLVSNLLTLAIALAPFDAFWLAFRFTAVKFGGSYHIFDGPAASSVSLSDLRRRLAQCSVVSASIVWFAVPASNTDPDGVVVGGRRPPRWPRSGTTDVALDMDESSTAASPTTAAPPAFPPRLACAVVMPEPSDGAPLTARIGTSVFLRAVIDHVVLPVEVCRKEPEQAQPQRSYHRGGDSAIRPSKRTVAVSNFLNLDNALQAAPKDAREKHRTIIGFGISGIPNDIHHLVLTFLTPRDLRRAQAVCRRFAFIIGKSWALASLARCSWEFGKRVEWFFEDEWGERVASLATLPARSSGNA
jgi:hypothetical protein